MEFGTPRELVSSGGWVLERDIDGTLFRDAMGCYPLFTCQDWSQLHLDFENLKADLVSLTVVTDPFGEYDESYLKKCFSDVVKPFKKHFIVDLKRPVNENISRHHRYYARKTLKEVSVKERNNSPEFIDDWIRLYSTLIDKYKLKGIKAFSRNALLKQMEVPGIRMFSAKSQDVTVAAQLWYVQGEVAYSHLTAMSDLGYRLRASYALYWHAIEYFIDKVRWLDLGGGAGLENDGKDGLSEFKRGWSRETRMAYFCGCILNRNRYSQIQTSKTQPQTEYFPQYRQGEFD
jgi:hypothetical protein